MEEELVQLLKDVALQERYYKNMVIDNEYHDKCVYCDGRETIWIYDFEQTDMRHHDHILHETSCATIRARKFLKEKGYKLGIYEINYISPESGSIVKSWGAGYAWQEVKHAYPGSFVMDIEHVGGMGEC
jgi:hypothetical protein